MTVSAENSVAVSSVTAQSDMHALDSEARMRRDVRKGDAGINRRERDSDANEIGAKFEELETLYGTVPCGLALLDRDCRFVRINARLAEMNGLPIEAHLGRTIREVVPHLADQADEMFRRIMRTGQPVLNTPFQGQTSAQPGVQRTWDESWHPVKNRTGRVIGINVIIEEITDRRQVEMALAESVRVKDALYRLTDRLQRARTLEDAYEAALDAITAALRCDRASILLFDDAGTMRFVGWRGLSDAYRRAVEGHSPWRRDDATAAPIILADIDTADLSDGLKDTVRAEGIGALAFIPLIGNGALLGKFMIYFDARRSLRSEEIDLCLAIARQLAFAIDHKRAVLALWESEQRFRRMIDALPAAIYTTDADGRLTHFNPAAVEFSGHLPRLGKDHWCVSWKLYNSDGTPLPHDQCPMAIALKEGRPIRGVEAIAERPDGTHRWFVPYPTPLHDAAGRVVGGINMLVDITHRKLAEQEMTRQARQLALITDTAPVYIAYCDAQSCYKFVNKAYAARFGLSPAECVGKHLADVIGRPAHERLRKHIDRVLRGEAVEFDAPLSYGALGERFMHCSYAPERDAEGGVLGWVAAITDITELKRIEEALRTSEEKLKQTDRRKDEFLAMLAHELRNPLAPIANAVHLLRTDRTDSPVLQQARAIIERQTGRLARLVDDLLEVSRITTGRIRLHMEPIAIGGVVERALETVRPLIEQHRHSFAMQLPAETVWVSADAARLEQVMVNLLGNAAKYTDDGGRIEMTVRTESGQAVVSVKDTGIGISPELLPQVFDLFTQSERSLDRSHGGLGIGLSLVQRLVSMHGGTVSASSTVGKGSEFTVRLPTIGAPYSAGAMATENPDIVSRSLRLLVVDDNVDAARSLAMLLELSGHVVRVAHDGIEAIEAAEQFRPQVVFLDIGLPKLDGYSVAAKLRAAANNLVLVAITGYGQAVDRERALLAGFDRHLVKPVEFSMVEQILSGIDRGNGQAA